MLVKLPQTSFAGGNKWHGICEIFAEIVEYVDLSWTEANLIIQDSSEFYKFSELIPKNGKLVYCTEERNVVESVIIVSKVNKTPIVLT